MVMFDVKEMSPVRKSCTCRTVRMRKCVADTPRFSMEVSDN